MKKIINSVVIAMVLMVVCAIGMTACSEQESGTLVSNTNEIWTASDSKHAKESIKLQNVVLGGIITIQNLDIYIERVIKGDNIELKINTSNLAVKVHDNVVYAVQCILDSMQLQGTVTVKDLENVLSKVSVDVTATISAESVVGVLKVNNVKNAFSIEQSGPSITEFNHPRSADKVWLEAAISLTGEHLISEFKPANEELISDGKSYASAFDSTGLAKIADGFIDMHMDKPFPNPEYTIGTVLHTTFGMTSAKSILDKHLLLSDVSTLYDLSVKDDKEYIKGMQVTANIRVDMTKSDVGVLVENIAKSLNDADMLNIYGFLAVAMEYDAVVVGKIDIYCDYIIN